MNLSHGMADPVSYSNADRDIEQAIVALKKGSQLLKYGRKGKPKFCPFRLSHDETSLIWISSNGEKNLKLSSVSRIVPGQRTAVFQRYLRPEKDYLSFSLIYNNGKRSLDLICKDKVEAEVWIAGLRALISHGYGGRSKIDGWNDGGLYLEDSRDLTSHRTSETSNRTSESSAKHTRHSSSPEISITISTNHSSPTNLRRENSIHHNNNNSIPHVPLDQTNMQHLVKGPGSDALRISVSSVPSTSSHGSLPDDCDTSGDVYIWGQVITNLNPNSNSPSTRTDVLLPKPLESTVVLDVHRISCGVHHAGLSTRQGEVFTWGEESGGRLGHGVCKDVTQPRLLESLSVSSNVDLIACGEFHTCAITSSGEVYSWGTGVLGHGTDISHWVPKRILGPIEGLQIAYVACGPWHTALLTSAGRLFTFGDGTFGVLGHGDKNSVWIPREVESLFGLKTISVACGVWHTAAIVEVIVSQSSPSVSSGKLFTWGDGDKNRLGQGDKDPRLEPTCVPALIDHNFLKIACGHSLTVGLTTSGTVFTMGSTVFGQLGNPNSDGKLPCLVEDKLITESVEEIACGDYHVAVLTSKNEVYTWGKGANGRLGHGDVEDRKTPVLVEALKDRHVKFVACGSSYTAAICLHKWISGAEQSLCSSCRQAFGFTRKRHNCYNCGLVHCHGCSSRKALRAALAPNPGKPYRVCDSCFVKLNKTPENTNSSNNSSNNTRRNSVQRISGENRDKLDKAEIRLAKSGIPVSNLDLIKQLDNKAAKQAKKSNAGDIGPTIPRPVISTTGFSSRATSPFSRRSSPPRSATPVPTTSGLSFSKTASESLIKTNELLNQEILKLRHQVEMLRHRCETQEEELEQSAKRTREAIAMAEEESSRTKAAKEVINSLTAQLKDIVERLPPGTYDTDSFRPAILPNGLKPNDSHNHPRTDSADYAYVSVNTSANGKGYLAEHVNPVVRNDNVASTLICNGSNEASVFQDTENHASPKLSEGQSETESIEQYEPGVYITLVSLQDGTRDLKRVRFSRRRFVENQAETWWSENRDKVYERYNVRISDKSSAVAGQPARLSGSMAV